MSNKAIRDLGILEELFYDQLQFKLSAVLKLQIFGGRHRRKIETYLKDLAILTKENINIVQKICDK